MKKSTSRDETDVIARIMSISSMFLGFSYFVPHGNHSHSPAQRTAKFTNYEIGEAKGEIRKKRRGRRKKGTEKKVTINWVSKLEEREKVKKKNYQRRLNVISVLVVRMVVRVDR